MLKTHSNQTAKQEHVVQPKDRKMLPSLMFSAVFHIAILLALSLIVFGTADGILPVTELVISESADLSITELPVFEPPKELEVAVDEPVDEPETVLETAPIAPPPKMQPAVIPVAMTSEKPSNGETAQAISEGLSKAANSIQSRVSLAGGRKGEVQFALAWKNVNDVDLHVIAPSGERISHLHRRSVCKGMLDVDMNVKGESQEPVENVRWITNAPMGRYTIIVNLFRIHRSASAGRVYRGSEFQLLAQLGDESKIEEDTVRRGRQIAVFRFQYVPDRFGPEQKLAFHQQLDELQAQEETTARPQLNRAKEVVQPQLRERMLNNVIIRFPHTDAAIEAMQLLGGEITKR